MQPRSSRFSLLVLMASIAILGLGLGAMRNGSSTADQVALSATLLALLVGLLGALVRREAGAWVGFALFGWASLLLTSIPALDESLGNRLLIKQPLEDLVERFNDIPPLPPYPPFQQATDSSGNANGKMVDGQWVAMSPQEIQANSDYLKQSNEHWLRYNQSQMAGKIDNSRRIGHSFLTLLIATLGAILGRSLSNRSKNAGASPEAEASTSPV